MAAPSNPGWKFGYVPSPGEWNNTFAGKVDYPASVAQGGTGGQDAFSGNYNLQQRAQVITTLLAAATLTLYSVRSDLNACTVTLPLAATCRAGDWIDIFDSGDNAAINNITINATSTDTILNNNATATLLLLRNNGARCILVSDGISAWRTQIISQSTGIGFAASAVRTITATMTVNKSYVGSLCKVTNAGTTITLPSSGFVEGNTIAFDNVDTINTVYFAPGTGNFPSLLLPGDCCIVVADGVGGWWTASYHTSINGIPEAPSDSIVYGRRNDSWVNAAMVVQNVGHIDFTSKTNGVAPATMDSGQATVKTANGTIPPTILSGRLIATGPFTTGSYADYYQTDLSAPIRRIGHTWTMPNTAETTHVSNMTCAAWASIYGGAGSGNVPAAWCHLSIVTSTATAGIGTALWYVCDGLGHLFAAKTQTFVTPVRDGQTRWATEAVLDYSAGKGYAWLPDGSIMVVTNADIAFIAGLLSYPVFTFQDVANVSVAMTEHFATSNANTSVFGQTCNFFADTLTDNPTTELSKFNTPLATMKRWANLVASLPASAASYIGYPATTVVDPTTTAASTIGDINSTVTCIAGPSGKINVCVTGYYECTATDTLFWRLVSSAGATQVRVALNTLAGLKTTVTQTITITGLTPGQSYNIVPQHFTVVAGTATLKMGGTGAAAFPPLSMLAIPA